MTTNSHNPFPLAMRPGEGGGALVRVQVATCGKCGTEQVFNRPHGKALPVEAIGKKLKLVGWTVKRDGAVLRCPTCEGCAPLVGDNGETLVSTCSCDQEGCGRELALPRRQHAAGAKGRAIPNSIVAQTAKAEGWLALPGKKDTPPAMYCPLHAIGIKSLAIVVDAIQLGEAEAMRRAIRDYGLTGDEARAALRDAESTARGSLGDETVDRALAALAAEMAIMAARQQQQERQAEQMHARTGGALDAPRVSTREDRRAIIEKLTAVYADDGYTGDWSDAKVAAALDMPVAWVVDLRSENFGDATESEADREARKVIQREVNTLKSDLKAVRADVTRALNAAAEADGKLPGIEARLAAAEAKLNARK